MARKILGLGLSDLFSRTALAVFYGLLTLIIFYEIPRILLGSYISAGSPFLNEGLFLPYAILITILSGLQIIFKNRYIGDAAAVSNGLAQIFYIYLVTNGGFFSEYVSSVQMTVSLDFRTVLYLMMIPSALLIVSTIISASSRVSVQHTEQFEEFVL